MDNIPSPPQRRPHNGQVILLADHEESVRSGCGDYLRNNGYSVINAENGLLAWKLFREFREVIDLLVAELDIPLMDGLELAGSARGIKPELSILLTADDPEPFGQHSGLLDGRTRMLRKPFGPDDLIAAVSELLKP